MGASTCNGVGTSSGGSCDVSKDEAKKLYLNTNTRDMLNRFSDETGLPLSLLVDRALQNGRRQRRNEAAGMFRWRDRMRLDDYAEMAQQRDEIIKRCDELTVRLDTLKSALNSSRHQKM